jgi:glycosyltransferase involved in cell wall biosynthesis
MRCPAHAEWGAAAEGWGMREAGWTMISQSSGPSVQLALSVVIPTRNRGNVVRRAVESVLRSSRNDIEAVVVDDGSSDDTAVRISQVTDPRLRFHHLDSTGSANRARNVGARLSTGALVAFLDSDDEFAARRIDRLIAFFSRHPDVDCLVDGYVEVGRRRSRAHRMPRATPDPQEIRRMLLAHVMPLTNSAITVRRAAFEAVGGYDESMRRHQDRELLLRLAAGHSIRFGDDIDVEKHRLARSISHALDGYIAGLDALAARCPDYRLPENAVMFRYLTVRGIVKAVATGHWAAAVREFRAWQRAKHLPKDYLRCFAAYRAGSRQRSLIRVDG